jgi:hypothetical protein
VLLGAKGEGVHVDTGIGGTGVVLEGLDHVEVRSLTLGEAVLAVKLKLGGHDRVLTPAVHVKGGLGKHEGAGIRKTTGRVLKDTVVNHGGRGGQVVTEGRHRVGKSINGIGVVERLGAKGLVKSVVATLQRGAVVNVLIGLDHPHKLLTGVVEVQLDLVGGRTHRLVTSELDLLDEVLMGVLCHLSALIGIKEDIVNVERSSYQRLLVSLGGTAVTGNGEKAFTDRTEVNVDLDLVVLKSNQRKGKSGVAAKPELKGYVKSGLRKSLARSTYLVRGTGSRAWSTDISVVLVGKVGKLSSVTDHLVVTRLLLLGKGKLVPDVHPVTVLTVNALTSNLNLNLSDELLTNVI